MTVEGSETTPVAEAAAETVESDGQVEAPATDEAVEEAPSGESSQDEPREYEAPVDIDSLPAELQEHAKSLEKQFKAEFSRKSAALAEERSLKGFELYKALEDPEHQEAAFEQLAEALGYRLSGDEAEDGEGEEDVSSDEAEGELEEPEVRDPRVDDLLEERKAEQRERQRKAIKSHIDTHLDTYRESLGLEELPGAIADEITTRALAMTPGADGLPRVGAAIEAFEAAKDAAIELYLESKRAETPVVDGETAVEQLDTSTEAGRLRAADAVAARHV